MSVKPLFTTSWSATSAVSTTITTFDNQTLVVPNSKIWGDVIKNITAQTERRIDLEIGIGYEADIAHAERVFTDIVEAHPKVLKHPEHFTQPHGQPPEKATHD